MGETSWPKICCFEYSHDLLEQLFEAFSSLESPMLDFQNIPLSVYSDYMEGFVSLWENWCKTRQRMPEPGDELYNAVIEKKKEAEQMAKGLM
jgi:hypothetical protein